MNGWESALVEAARQVPALLVLVGLVYLAVRQIVKVGEALAKRWEEQTAVREAKVVEALDRSTKAIERNTTVIDEANKTSGQVAAVLGDARDILRRMLNSPK